METLDSCQRDTQRIRRIAQGRVALDGRQRHTPCSTAQHSTACALHNTRVPQLGGLVVRALDLALVRGARDAKDLVVVLALGLLYRGVGAPDADTTRTREGGRKKHSAQTGATRRKNKTAILVVVLVA